MDLFERTKVKCFLLSIFYLPLFFTDFPDKSVQYFLNRLPRGISCQLGLLVTQFAKRHLFVLLACFDHSKESHVASSNTYERKSQAVRSHSISLSGPLGNSSSRTVDTFNGIV